MDRKLSNFKKRFRLKSITRIRSLHSLWFCRDSQNSKFSGKFISDYVSVDFSGHFGRMSVTSVVEHRNPVTGSLGFEQLLVSFRKQIEMFLNTRWNHRAQMNTGEQQGNTREHNKQQTNNSVANWWKSKHHQVCGIQMLTRPPFKGAQCFDDEKFCFGFFIRFCLTFCIRFSSRTSRIRPLARVRCDVHRTRSTRLPEWNLSETSQKFPPHPQRDYKPFRFAVHTVNGVIFSQFSWLNLICATHNWFLAASLCSHTGGDNSLL